MIQKGHSIPILGLGHVVYLDHLGSDTRIAEAARVSYQEGSKGEEADAKLIAYLFKNRHTSPFEQCNITMEIKMPIFIMRQFVRHRTFKLNEWSGRYTELPDENFMPIHWRVQDTVNRQGSLTRVESIYAPWHEENSHIASIAFKTARFCYEQLLEQGVAKEQARIVLPLAIFTQIHVNMDLHNLLHFLYLRTHPHAQEEIRELAFAMLQIVRELFPVSAKLFENYEPKIVDRETILGFDD